MHGENFIIGIIFVLLQMKLELCPSDPLLQRSSTVIRSIHEYALIVCSGNYSTKFLEPLLVSSLIGFGEHIFSSVS